MKELAKRLAKAMPERFTFVDAPDGYLFYSGQHGASNRHDAERWWSLIGPLMDELKIFPRDVGATLPRCETWLLSCFHAVVEAAEARNA